MQQLQRGGRDRMDAASSDVDYVVIAEHAWITGDVLLADQRRPVAGRAQRVDDVPVIVDQPPAAVRQTRHPVHVRPLASQ